MGKRRRGKKRGPFAVNVAKKIMNSKKPLLVDIESKTIISMDESNVDKVFEKFFGKKRR